MKCTYNDTLGVYEVWYHGKFLTVDTERDWAIKKAITKLEDEGIEYGGQDPDMMAHDAEIALENAIENQRNETTTY